MKSVCACVCVVREERWWSEGSSSGGSWKNIAGLYGAVTRMDRSTETSCQSGGRCRSCGSK